MGSPNVLTTAERVITEAEEKAKRKNLVELIKGISAPTTISGKLAYLIYDRIKEESGKGGKYEGPSSFDFLTIQESSGKRVLAGSNGKLLPRINSILRIGNAHIAELDDVVDDLGKRREFYNDVAISVRQVTSGEIKEGSLNEYNMPKMDMLTNKLLLPIKSDISSRYHNESLIFIPFSNLSLVYDKEVEDNMALHLIKRSKVYTFNEFFKDSKSRGMAMESLRRRKTPLSYGLSVVSVTPSGSIEISDNGIQCSGQSGRIIAVPDNYKGKKSVLI